MSGTDERAGDRGWRLPLAAAFAFAAALAAVEVWFGPLNHDEGWYLLAAQNVARGMVPYRDFLYTQGPVMPRVYAALSLLWSGHGVLGGRVLTALFGLAAAAAFAAAAGRVASRVDRGAGAPAAFFAFVMLALSPDWAYFSAIPKTYSLCAFFLGLGLLAVSGERRRFPFLSGAAFAFAAATRATFCLAAVPVWLALVAEALRRKDRRPWRDPALFAAGCVAALALCYVPVALSCLDNFVFSQTYHTSRAAAPLGRWAVLRAGFLCFLAQGYPAFVAAAAVLWSHGRMVARSDGRMVGQPDGRTVARSDRFVWPVAAAFVLPTLAHFMVPFPYADYNTPAMPFAAVALAVPLGLLAARARLHPLRVGLAALAASVAFVAASPWPMKWVGGRQDRFWFVTDGQTALSRLREAGAAVRAANPDGKPILAQDAYLAVEAGVPVVPGLEMGPFSLFPDLDDETALARRVHNVSTLSAAIRGTDARVAAIGGYTFAMACPSTDPLDPDTAGALAEAVAERFPETVAEWPRFGQQDAPMLILKR